MKNLLVIAMALVSVSAFAAHSDAHKAAMEACKEHASDKKAMASCVAEKVKASDAAVKTATATTTTTTTTAPATKK